MYQGTDFWFFCCQVLGIYSGDITGDGVREFVLVLEDGVRVLKVKQKNKKNKMCTLTLIHVRVLQVESARLNPKP